MERSEEAQLPEGIPGPKMIEAGTPEAEHFEKTLWRQGRNKVPDLFLDAVLDEAISTELMREMILEVWCAAELPTRAIGGEPGMGEVFWLSMFRQTGFVADTDELPEMPLTVFRGAPVDKPHGFSWSWDREVAKWFANRYQMAFHTQCGVYSVTLEQEHLLGLITEGRGECEVIVNPEILTGDLEPALVEELEPPAPGEPKQSLNLY